MALADLVVVPYAGVRTCALRCIGSRHGLCTYFGARHHVTCAALAARAGAHRSTVPRRRAARTRRSPCHRAVRSGWARPAQANGGGGRAIQLGKRALRARRTTCGAFIGGVPTRARGACSGGVGVVVERARRTGRTHNCAK